MGAINILPAEVACGYCGDADELPAPAQRRANGQTVLGIDRVRAQSQYLRRARV